MILYSQRLQTPSLFHVEKLKEPNVCSERTGWDGGRGAIRTDSHLLPKLLSSFLSVQACLLIERERVSLILLLGSTIV
jgi:hypothetical protein